MSFAAKSLLAIGLLLSTFAVTNASFADAAEPAWKFNRSFNAWSTSLDVIATSLEQAENINENDEAIRAELLEIREQALRARKAADKFAAETENLLAALGDPPAEGEPEEAPDLQRKRQAYEAEVANFRGRAAQAQLIIKRVDTQHARLSEIEQGQALRTLLTRTPSPFGWQVISAAPGQTGAYFTSLAIAVDAWWQAPASEEDTETKRAIAIGTVVVLLIISLIARHLLVKWFGRNEQLQNPSYTRRLLAASTETLANGFLPALFASALWLTANKTLGLDDGPFLNLINGVVVFLLVVITALALPRAALSPALPHWRVAPIKPKYARRLTQSLGTLGVLFGLDIFVSFTSADAGPAFLAAYSAIATTFEVILILDLLRPALWRSDPEWRAGTQDQEEGSASKNKSELPPHQITMWLTLRVSVILLAITGALAAWIGYTALSVYLIGNLIGTALIIGALFLARALFAEWISIIMSREEVANWLNLSNEGTSTVRFWFISLLQVLVYISGAVLIGAVWGIPLRDIWTVTYNLLTAINIGGITISITDIASAILVLLVTLLVFRLGKALLRDTVLPQTRLDPGAQYSIATIFGYLGIVVSVVMAAVSLGVEFQNLLIIAGALSVGIGFGLQTIANNFISGLILLFERPIKVGDLIEIDNTLGHVTHINVRRTEVETFQRAEVMIPNSELISTSVINWTHSDRKARIEINVGVAYGSNTELVRETLVKAAENVDKVVTWPGADVLFLDFGDSSLNFQLRCFTSDVSSRITTASKLRFEIDRLFREAGIEIPFPQRVIHMAPEGNPEK